MAAGTADRDDLKTPARVKLAEIGDEAHVDKTGTMVIARKGSVAIQVVPAGVSAKAPMPAKQGVVELAKRIVVRLK